VVCQCYRLTLELQIVTSMMLLQCTPPAAQCRHEGVH
jgi:hypothetical protein